VSSSAPESQPIYVFVYGTLRRGDSNDINKLNPAPVWLGYGTVRGTLYDFGDYPGIVLADEGSDGSHSAVLGEIYRASPALIPVLDDIEMMYPDVPHLYRQVWRSVTCGAAHYNCLLYELTDAGQSAYGRITAAPGALLDWASFRLQRG
jgi:gamma-glutamylcyclotransferase (GGCT)/AIG2-like uncharacterized protein YtfP